MPGDKTSKILKEYKKKPEKYWFSLRQKNILSWFHKMVKDIPAYGKFLKQHNFNPASVKSAEDLKLVPYINKKNYFQKFTIPELIGKKFQTEPFVFTSTSGSTGQPTYFLRDESLDWQYSILAEMFMQNGKKGTTLFVDCFGMGVWIGGLITYQAFRYCSLRGYPLSIITPGVNKKEIFHSLENAAPYFDNVILAGYPPFIKDVIDEAKSEGINFSKLNTRLIFAAEAFTENFRQYLADKVHVKNIYIDTLNIYGSAELGAMAFETPATILIRKLALRHPKVYSQIFNSEKLPTLAQYNPMFVNFEEENREILISADAATPMVRYKIGDNGGTLRLSEIINAFAQHNIDLKSEAKKDGVELYELPFVYVYERTDLSTKLYGAIIYPEPIREALLDKRLSKYLTGKFTMITKFDNKQNEYLEINLETMPGLKSKGSLHNQCRDLIVESLLKKNAEYRNNYGSMPHKVTPKILFWEYGHASHFGSGGKHKWTKTA